MGYIIIDGDSVVIARIVSSTHQRELLWRNKRTAPNHTSRGGQSQNRLARIRNEKDDMWVKQAAEAALETLWDQKISS